MSAPSDHEINVMRHILSTENSAIQFGCDETAQDMRERGFITRGKRTPASYYWHVVPEWEEFLSRVVPIAEISKASADCQKRRLPVPGDPVKFEGVTVGRVEEVIAK